MKKPILLFLLFFLCLAGIAQNPGRIKITAITPSINTGQDYSSWLTDDLTNLVPDCWNPSNFQYIDVTLQLSGKSLISKLSLFDYQGVFTDNPASIYALNGTQKTLIGTFDGHQYNVFVDLVPSQPLIADAIIIHKYCNDIPEKVEIFGTAYSSNPSPAQPTQSVISFNNLPAQTAGATAFNLSATSNNTETPVIFSSSDPSIVAVSNASGTWTAKPLAAGTATITASQAGNSDYLAAADVARNEVVQAAPVATSGKPVPGRIEAENYDAMSGIQTENTSDAGGGQDVGWINDNDWMDYQVAVATTGAYTINLRLASPNNNGSVTIQSFAGTVLANVAVPITGGWQNWTTVTTTISLTAGTQTLRIYAQKGGWNINWFEAVFNNNNSGSTPVTTGKVPIDPKRWFQLTNATNGLDGLFDGDTVTAVQTGWGKILNNYDSYYPVLNGEEIDLTGLRMFDGAGSNQSQPVTLFVITSDGQKIPVATFTGSQYNTWVGPDPNNPTQFNFSTPYNNIKYLVMNSWNSFPTEIEFYGNYKAGNSSGAAAKKSFPLQQMFGVNGFEWNFEDPNSPGQINPQSFQAAKTFTGFRHYMDWDKLELTQGSYTFNPTLSGGWNYDVLYDSCKAAGIQVLACLKTLPGWMLNTYPSDQQDPENVPVQYGKDFSDPMSYIEQAKVAFQYAARYGSNKNVDRSLLSINSTPRWSGDVVNTVKVGLGSIQYIECDNERDKWWKGRKAYQTAFEYAANLSAFYDGNKNTMGPGVGVKNADPNMKVVMAGTALATTDYVKGMVDWCRQHRGYRADGTVDLCWDVINYHYYSNDSYTSQSGNATRGAAPEVSGTAAIADAFIQAAHQYANDMPVWVTELGYDINQGSPFKAIPIGNKTALQTQADWILRSSLLYARSGVERIFFYELYDDNVSNSLQFSSSGLINPDKTRKPAADYIYQTNHLLGAYTYAATINSDPVVDRYELNGNAAYAIVVPDEKGRTAQYTLDLGNAAYAKIYTPKIGSDTMDLQVMPTSSGQLTITATETPTFIMAVGDGNNNQLSATKAEKNNLSEEQNNLKNAILIYPNPATNCMNIIINNQDQSEVQIKVSEAGSGRIFKNIQFSKAAGYVSQSIDIHALPVGYYMVEIKQGNKKMVKKILKTY